MTTNGNNPPAMMWEYNGLTYEEKRKAEQAARAVPVLWVKIGDDLSGYHSEYLSCDVRFNWIHPQDGKRRNYALESTAQLSPLGDLRISAQAGDPKDHDNRFRTYGWSVEYFNLYTVNLEIAEDMVKLLRKIRRGLIKLEQLEGLPLSFGQYVGRVARVLGVKWVAFEDKHGVNGMMITPLGEGIGLLDYRYQLKAREKWPVSMAA